MDSETTTSVNVSACEYAVSHVLYKSGSRSTEAVKLCVRLQQNAGSRGLATCRAPSVIRMPD
jgi:hypothetical protein